MVVIRFKVRPFYTETIRNQAQIRCFRCGFHFDMAPRTAELKPRDMSSKVAFVHSKCSISSYLVVHFLESSLLVHYGNMNYKYSVMNYDKQVVVSVTVYLPCWLCL